MIIEIALGIVLAVIILALLPQILGIGIFLIVLALIVGFFVLLATEPRETLHKRPSCSAI